MKYLAVPFAALTSTALIACGAIPAPGVFSQPGPGYQRQATVYTPAPVQAPLYTPAPAQVYSSAPSQVYSSAPSQVYSSAPSQVYSSAPSQVYTSAPAQVYNAAPQQVYRTAPAQVYTSAPAAVTVASPTYQQAAPAYQPSRASYQPQSAPVIQSAPTPAPAPVIVTREVPQPPPVEAQVTAPPPTATQYRVAAVQTQPSPTIQRISRIAAAPPPPPPASTPQGQYRVADASPSPATAYPRRKPSASATAAPQPRASSVSEPLRVAMPRQDRSYLTKGTPPTIEYQIPHLPQEEPLWCWAAAAQQAIGWVNKGRAPAQCAIVALAHGMSVEECCADRDGICARTGEIPAIAKLVERFGGQATELTSVPRTPEAVYDVLRGGGTLLIRLRPAPHDAAVGIRHMIVVRGIEWLRLPNNELHATLLYNDPLGAGERAVSFNEIEGFFEQALMIRRI